MAGGILLLMLGVSQIDARKINFKVNKETTIQEFITMFSKVKKKNILIDGEIKGKINFISPLGYIEEDELLTLLKLFWNKKDDHSPTKETTIRLIEDKRTRRVTVYHKTRELLLGRRWERDFLN